MLINSIIIITFSITIMIIDYFIAEIFIIRIIVLMNYNFIFSLMFICFIIIMITIFIN